MVDFTQAVRSEPNYGPLDNGIPGRPGYVNWEGPAAAGPGGTIYGTTPTASGGSSGAPGFAEYLRSNNGAGDAWAYLESLLGSYGLGALNDFAKQSIIDGLSTNEIVQRLRTTEPYKQRFQAIEQRRAAGLPAISEAEVIQYEKQATAMMRSAGLPSGFWDEPSDFVKLQTNDVSLAELQGRINDGYLAAMQAPQDVRDQWSALGYTEGDLAAYMLDPDRTEAVLTKQIGATQRAAEAQRIGFGQLSRDEAEQLQSLGVTSAQAQDGFSTLVQQRELMSSLPGEGADEITRDQQLAAVFQNNVAQQQRLKRRASERAAAFMQGGGFATSRDGFAGIGAAR